LAYLKAVASEDAEAIRVLTEPGDLLEIVEGLADLVLLFIEDLSDNPASHIDLMFQAVSVAQKGREWLSLKGALWRLLRSLRRLGGP
jgi:hypothetical protein